MATALFSRVAIVPDPALRKPGSGGASLMLRHWWRWVQARFRLDLDVVCELSRGRGLTDDFHDYPDSTVGEPWHFYIHTCKRCGKEFTI